MRFVMEPFRYFLFFLLVTDGLCKIYRRDPKVNSPAGRFRGKILQASNGRPYNSFRGIPYAKPPVGNLRFAKPQPLPKIKGIFKAKDFGPICIQPKGFGSDRGQEDCLSLNVFTPFGSPSRRPRKVLVYVHGGGGISGSSREYLPGDLVTTERIVVVTLNYRLGYFGFLRGDPEELPGNQALGDVLLALNWIKDNIKQFGGNPSQVTLSGQGMGSFYGMYLSISPLAKDLFKRAIFSGSGFVNYPFPPPTSTDLLERAINELGCSQSGDPIDVQAAIVCLKDLPALDFDTQFGFVFFTLITTSHDEILPRRPQELWSNSTYLASVGFASRDYLVELAKDDGLYSYDNILQSIDISTPEISETNLAAALEIPLERLQGGLRPYRLLRPGDERAAVTFYFTDFFRRQLTNFLEALAIVDIPDAGDAYFLSFDYEPSYMPDQIVPRSLELAYLFDISPRRILEISYPKLSVQGPFTFRDRRLKRLFINVVSDFVKSGDPGITILRKFRVDWPPYEDEAKSFLSFSLAPKVDQDFLDGRFMQ